MTIFKKLFSLGSKHPREFIYFIFYFPRFLKLTGRLLKDVRVPIKLKIVLVAAIIYFILPLDLLPDFIIPFAGYIDDLVILYFSVKFFFEKCPREVLMEHVHRIEAEKQN